jgi:hypothetical protein
MSGLLITIIVVFFAVGITFGVITVHALSALRAERRGQPDYGSRYEPEAEASRLGEPPAESGPDVAGQEDQPRWPGDGHNDFRDW